MVGEREQVLGALAQRRQVDVHDVEAVVEILAEGARLEARVEVLVGGGDDAHVDALGPRGAERPDLALLQDAQELGLQRGRQLGDLVEEQRAAVGFDEEPGPV